MHLELRGHVTVQLDWDGELSERLQRLGEMDPLAIDLEALLRERFGDIAIVTEP